MTREEMVEQLRNRLCEVTFTKKDGTERVMECSLNPMFIPEDQMPKEDSEGVQRTIDVISCFDVRVAGWRSFRVESVKNFR
jgi:hypothetical protein